MNTNVIEILQVSSVKILVKKEFKGTGVFYKKDKNCYVFTAAHVLYGQYFDKQIEITDISISNADGILLNLPILELITPDNFIENDLDIVALKITDDLLENIDSGYLISNEVGPETKFQFRGCPNQSDNNFRNFEKYELNDFSNYNFKIKGPPEDFLYLPSASDDSQNGISGSGIFFLQNNCQYLYGIFVGVTERESAFCLIDCIKIEALKEKVSLDYVSLMPDSSDLLGRLNAYRKEIEEIEIKKFKDEKNEFIDNLNRKMDIICDGNDNDTIDMVRAHIESFLFGSAFLEYLDMYDGELRNKHDMLLNSFKVTLRQGTKLVFELREAISKYEEFKKRYETLVVQEFSKYGISHEKLTRLSSFGIASCLAICEFDIRYKEDVKK